MVLVPDRTDIGAVVAALKERNPEQIVAIRLTASPDTAARAVELAGKGAEVLHLVFDSHGRESASKNSRHARDVIREVHGALVKDGRRDRITIIASGGIAQAEHMAKAIICGADLVAIDIPLMIALECRLCGECDRGERCQIALDEIDPHFAIERIINLMGAWHSQLLELMGAMGIREVRRLRGEVGRCMFFEDLEREIFAPLFGTRREGSVLI
jgi:glutamate synthase domain-containing protein 2